MKDAFCTICDSGNLSRAAALFRSLQDNGSQTEFVLLYLGKDDARLPEGIRRIQPDNLSERKQAAAILKRYGRKPEILAKAIKASLLIQLLESFERVIFLDPQIGFCASPQILWEELGESTILLSSHRRSIEPEANPKAFLANFREGQFNAGFIGATRNGIQALEWWETVCEYNCTIDVKGGFWYEQRYLDSMPVRFENVRIIQNEGCQIARWNRDVLKRETPDGQLRINGKSEPVFVHWDDELMGEIDRGEADAELAPLLESYRAQLSEVPG